MGSAANLADVRHLKPVPDPKPPPKLHERSEARPSIRELERWATVLRLDCVRMVAVAKSGHLDSSLSAADITAALYYRVLRHDPSNPNWPERDRFVLSKGHAAPIQYAALAEHGYFPADDLMGLRKIGSHLQGHPDMTRTPGIEVSTGSLGQGLSMCVGICLALRLDDLSDVSQVFCLMSDGDCQEGESWEGAMSAAHYGLTNLTAIVDYNHLQTDGTTEEVMDTGDVRAKFEAFGDALVALGEAHEEVVALDADLAVSTQSMKFGKQFPERFFNVGAAEANMMSIACGLAATGKVPYASTFAIFATGRAYDQVRLGIAHNELKVRIGASHGGVSLGEDGASHQMIEDIALMRVMPRMTVVVPADYNQAYRATLESYERDEPMYLRFGRPATPIVYEDIPQTLGSGVDVLREGKDISLIATGHMVWRAIEAAESLEQ